MSIIENQSVHGAARQLGLTQTAVTQRIRSLEGQLKTTLFIRSRRGMHPTPEGEALKRYCQGARDLEGTALSLIQSAAVGSEISVTLAGPTSIMASRVIPALKSVYAKNPSLLLHFEINDTENRADLLRKGDVQLAILSPEQVTNEMDSKVLKPDRYILVGSSKWKNRRTSDIVKNERIIDFYESDHTTFKYLKKFSLFAGAKKSRLFVNSNESLIQLFSEGVGYGTLTSEVAEPWIASGKIIPLNQRHIMEDPQALAWYPRPQMPHYFRTVLDLIK